MMNKKIATEVAVGIIVIIAIIVGGYFWLQNQPKFGPGSIPKVESFDECVRKGFPVMESYPRRCKTSLGKEFIEEIKTEEKANLEADELADWQTYRNEELGIEFEYPNKYGNVVAKNFNKNDYFRNSDEIELYFDNDNYYFFVVMHLQDSSGAGSDGYTYNSIKQDCAKLKNCREVSSINSDRTYIKSSFTAMECSPFFRITAYLKNDKYANIEIITTLKDISDKIDNLYTCVDEKKEREATLLIDEIAENVFKEEKLSRNDKSALKEFEKILSTFKFIN